MGNKQANIVASKKKFVYVPRAIPAPPSLLSQKKKPTGTVTPEQEVKKKPKRKLTFKQWRALSRSNKTLARRGYQG